MVGDIPIKPLLGVLGFNFDAAVPDDDTGLADEALDDNNKEEVITQVLD